VRTTPNYKICTVNSADSRKGGESLPAALRGKDFLLKGGNSTLAISKERKNELIQEYIKWAGQSQAMYLTEYRGLSMKQIDDLRSRVRAVGGEFHIVKNTLSKVAFEEAGLEAPDRLLVGSTAVLFAFTSAPDTAKVLTEVARGSEFVKIKGKTPDQRKRYSIAR
jgi:ribosomal protein L10